MKKTVSISEMRVHLPRILAEVERGREFVVTSRGRSVARLVSVTSAPSLPRQVVYDDESILVNLTPHVIAIANAAGEIVREIPPTPPAARVSTRRPRVEREPIAGVPFAETVMGRVENLPDEDGRRIYIVSRVVISALPDRTDLVCPDTGPDCVRDEGGRVVAVRRLTQR